MKIYLPNERFEDQKPHSVLQIPLSLTEEEFPLIPTQKRGSNIMTLGIFKKFGPKTKTGKLDDN